MSFSYAEMTTRNIGFVSPSEQERLRGSRVLVIGTGGMGGACLQTLARAGVGSFELADFDAFEVSNLNRQVFANLDTIGTAKAEATRGALLKINPECEIGVHGRDWTEKLDELLSRCKVVVNGMDDVAAGIHLYRKAREHGATVVDAYSAPLPSVMVAGPGDPVPEERLGYPTRATPWKQITREQLDECKLRELEYVLIHSSSAKAVHLEIAAEMFTGKRSRISFAPMVILTGNLMAFEVLKLLLGQRGVTGHRGYFFDPARGRIERPRPRLIVGPMRYLVRRFLKKTLAGAPS